MSTKKFGIISDVHGNYRAHIDICSNYEYTLQVGDLGYEYSYLKLIDSDKHKFIAGNHDNHKICYGLPHCLGRFGYTEHGGIKFFFVSGGFSIDYKIRNEKYYSGEWPKTYFENEELTEHEQNSCIALYKDVKPDIIISHEAPRCTVGDFTNSYILKNFGFDPETFTTATSELLNSLWDIHRPLLHICGHYHKNFYKKYGQTNFYVLEELGVLEI